MIAPLHPSTGAPVQHRTMATHLDLEEQEQIEQLKHFWNRWGRLISGALLAVLCVVGARMLYQQWRIHQAAQAEVLAQAVDMALTQNNAAQADQAFAQLRDQYPATVQTYQSALALAKAAVEGERLDDAKALLTWLADHGDTGYRAIAKLRLSAVLQEQKQYDAALQALDGDIPEFFAAAVADRRGDIYAAQGQRAQAIQQYQQAFASIAEAGFIYSQIIEVKLNALGAEPLPPVRAEKAQP